jgi:hypothetical protein
MDYPVKLCPECGAEYFAHITECGTCEVALIFPEELEKGPAPKAEGDLVPIMQGDLQKMKEIAYGLKSKEIECQVLNAGGVGSSCCSSDGGYAVFVHQSIAREAARAADEVYRKLHPEIDEMDERYRQGQCPACGADARNAPGVCQDCGLNLGGF